MDVATGRQRTAGEKTPEEAQQMIVSHGRARDRWDTDVSRASRWQALRFSQQQVGKRRKANKHQVSEHESWGMHAQRAA